MPCTAVSMRGPSVTPALMALRRPTSTKSCAPDIAHGGEAGLERAPGVHAPRTGPARPGSASGGCRRRGSSPSRTRSVRCVCASMKPGSSVASPRSMTRAPAGSAPAADRHDAIAAHHHGGAVLECGAGGIEHVGGLQHEGFGRGSGGARADRCAQRRQRQRDM